MTPPLPQTPPVPLRAGRPPTVVLIDVDGTLVDYELAIPPSAAQAIRSARSRGHQVFLCTGRSRAEIYPELWALGVDGFIGGNGSYIEVGGEAIHHQVLPVDVVRRAVAWLVASDLGYYLECNSGLYGSTNLPERGAQAVWEDWESRVEFVRSSFPHMIFGQAEARDDVNKISFALTRDVDLAWLAEEYAGEAKIDTWSASGEKQEFGEIGQVGITKAAGVARLAAHLGVDASEFIAFGDGRNDVELFAACGFGVAMGNAEAELLAVADYVTDHVAEHGLANAFAHLGLSEPVGGAA